MSNFFEIMKSILTMTFSFKLDTGPVPARGPIYVTVSVLIYVVHMKFEVNQFFSMFLYILSC